MESILYKIVVVISCIITCIVYVLTAKYFDGD